MKDMTENEMQSTSGGLGFLATVAVGLIVGAAVNIMNNWDDFKDGLAGRPVQKC
ncbi:MAG TPA: class IIb bacteriocin, lactobin A/cerein 7B family [Lacunisphaera sp.]|nr:class IIb bacteriocin, lactobin A/cerein 7B family [Lacunisphaera sp.]